MLSARQYATLEQPSEHVGLRLAELLEEDAPDHSFGAWHDRDFDGATYVEELRSGLGRRLGS